MPSRNTYCLTWASVTSDVECLFTAAPAKRSRCSLPWTRGIFWPAASGCTEAWPWGATPRPRSGAATESARLRQRRSGGREERPHLGGQGPRQRGAPHLQGAAAAGRRRAERSYSTSPRSRRCLVLSHSFLNFEPVSCYRSDSNCCFLTCIQVFQETDTVIW